ncbi:MAG: transglycosylase domain-containing protein, partial [Oscillospiraceae bacterium]|nr:transglycosylase domain-containing protein [Oscillospiraceae bacterium]
MFIGAAATVLLIVLACGFVLAGALGDYLEQDILPSAGLVLENYDMDSPSYIYYVDENGDIQKLQDIHASTSWENADFEELPKPLIHAAVAIEDKRFYEHQGVDWFTTIKAFANMFFGTTTVGGSSITQQLIKNRTGADSVTVQRKVMEFFQATLVEKNYDKDTIMEMYMNSIYLGQGCRGVKSAAKTYYGKPLQTLTVAECASLISITNNPSLYDPYSDSEFSFEGQVRNGKERNRYRMMLVLDEMLSQGYITQEEYTEAVAQELVLKNGIAPEDRWIVCGNENCDYQGLAATYKASGENLICPKCGHNNEKELNHSQEVYSYFVDTLLMDLAKDLAAKDGITNWNKDVWENYLELISRSGYHIYSTLDMRVQNQIDKIYKDLKEIPDTRSAQQIQSAIVVVNSETGDIAGMAGGVGNDKVHFGLNRATQSKLQSGSSIKPLSIYAPGFEQGTITPATVIKDLPLNYTNGAWPHNDTRTYSYTRTVYTGIQESVNAVAANTLKLIGDSYGFSYLTKSFGISTLVEPEDMNFASLALGAQHYGVTVRDMAAAFATFTNDGVYREARTYTKVYDSKGNLVLENTQDAKEILGEKAVNYTNYCLVNAVNKGTGENAAISGMQIAGKTGTTSNRKDRWFCGYSGYYTAALWMGYDQPEEITLSPNPAPKLWKKVMGPLHKDLKNVSLYDTSKMTSVTVCLDSGKIATDACRADIRGARTETVMVYPEDKPKGTCDKHTMVELCSSGTGAATEYCRNFAAVDPNVKLTPKALLKLNAKELQEIQKAMGSGLTGQYTRDDYIYLVDSNGKDAAFYGLRNNINSGVVAPYKVCTVHTQKNWLGQQTGNQG